jgi:hypothetical protein
MAIRTRILSLAGVVLLMTACGGESESPTRPSESQSFLAGTWRGDVTIERQNQTPTTGTTTWTFTTEPGTNRQTLRTSIRVDHPWLGITSTSSTAVTPSPDPPARVSTQGNYMSPRGCQASLASIGEATATRIVATFEGVDCGETFRGSVNLTKDQ